MNVMNFSVIPAKAGIQARGFLRGRPWTPAYAGVTAVSEGASL
jgi:hypothetical protein